MFLYDHALHHGRNDLYRYFFQSFSTAEILKSHVTYYLKVNGKQLIKMPKK